jgi:hypothetical protein
MQMHIDAMTALLLDDPTNESTVYLLLIGANHKIMR